MTPALAAAGQGFGLMLSLIVAIGAQNSYLLRYGIRRTHVTPLVLICWLSDVTLVLVGVGGMGALVSRLPVLMTVVTVAGAAVLLGYAALAVRRAIRGETWEVESGDQRARLAPAVLGCLAITWLNPQVYLDTVVMIGAVANTHPGADRWWFAAGTLVGSIVWFCALGYGAAALRPLFRRPVAWRVLDSIIAAVMVAMAIRLLVG